MFDCFAVSVKGRDKVLNQDYFAFTKTKKGIFLAVCDGLGSKIKSHFGSKILAKNAVKLAKKMLLNEKKLKFYEQKLMDIWINKIRNPQDLKEYSTTFLCVFVYDDFAYVGRVGDGVVVIFGKENIYLEHNGDFANFTTPFGTKNIEWDIIKTSSIDSIAICSDGICEFLDKNKKMDFFKKYTDEYKDIEPKIRTAEITEWLNNFNKLGFKDDKTILVAYRNKDDKKS